MATEYAGFARYGPFDPFPIRPHQVEYLEDLCSRLIQVSVEKIVSSKHERGGAKLHKNLLILHLLKTARTQQRRSSSPTECVDTAYYAPPEACESVEIEEETIYLPDLPREEEEEILHDQHEMEMTEASTSVPFNYSLTPALPADTGSEEVDSGPRLRRSLSSGYESSPDSGSSGSSSEDDEAPSSPDSTSSDEGSGKRKRKRQSNSETEHKRTRSDQAVEDSYSGERLNRLISVFNSVELFPPPGLASLA